MWVRRRHPRARTHPELDVTPRLEVGRQRIQSYGGGGFKIGGQRFVGSVVVLPDQVLPWTCSDYPSLTNSHFDAIRDYAETVDILLLGCGGQAAPPRPDLVEFLRHDGIVLETMDTGAACRTFNVLLLEDRRVAAMLIAVE